jgi:hypothetical protein
MKTFNQFLYELKSSTYKKAGEELKKRGHILRGDKLIDYSKKDNIGSSVYIEYIDNNRKIKTINIKDIIVDKENYKVYDKTNNYIIFDKESTKIYNRKSAVLLWKLLKTYDINVNINNLYKEQKKFDEKYVLSKLDNDNKIKIYYFFKKFLLENNIFDKFYDNLFNDKLSIFKWYLKLKEDKIGLTNENKVIYFFNYNKTDLKYVRQVLIDLSFVWKHTKEGYDYWLDIKHKFNQYNPK